MFVDLWAAGRRLDSQASFLRRQIDAQPDGADVLGVLQDRLDDVSRAAEDLQEALEADDLPVARGAAQRIRSEIDGLGASLAALDQGGRATGLTRREFG